MTSLSAETLLPAYIIRLGTGSRTFLYICRSHRWRRRIFLGTPFSFEFGCKCRSRKPCSRLLDKSLLYRLGMRLFHPLFTSAFFGEDLGDNQWISRFTSFLTVSLLFFNKNNRPLLCGLSKDGYSRLTINSIPITISLSWIF